MIRANIISITRCILIAIVAAALTACGSSGSGSDTSAGSSDAGTLTAGGGSTAGGTAGGGTDTTGATTGGGDPENIDTVVFPEVQPFDPAFADSDSGSVYANSPNSARLSGPVVGSAEVPTSEVFKSIPFIASNVEPELEVLHAILHRTGAESGTAYITILVRNNSADILCSLNHGIIRAYDNDSNLITGNSAGSGTVFGPMGVDSTGRLTDTCISPGQIVYITALYGATVTIDNTSGVTIESLGAGNAGTAATIAVAPISYEVNDSRMEITIMNNSSETIELTGSKIYVLSDSGAPIYFTGEGFNDTNLAPGAEMIIDASSTRFRGSATSLRVMVDYRVPGS